MSNQEQAEKPTYHYYDTIHHCLNIKRSPYLSTHLSCMLYEHGKIRLYTFLSVYIFLSDFLKFLKKVFKCGLGQAFYACVICV